MSNVRFTDMHDRTIQMQHMTVPGNAIRYVVIPDHIDVAQALNAHEHKLVALRDKHARISGSSSK
jgi:hypothetical protein